MGNSNPFSTLFGKSPFKPLQQHMRTVTECAEQIPEILAAQNSGDATKVSAIKDKIFELENTADSIKNEMRARLPKSLFMPVDRRDLLDLLDMQDCIADTAQEIAGLMVSRNMEIPVGMGDPLVALAKRCVDACRQSASIIEELDELVEMGFGGKESSKVLEMIAELGNIENDTDRMGIELTKNLFAHEDELKPVSVMFWYQMIRWIGNLADYAEKAGDRLRLLMAR